MRKTAWPLLLLVGVALFLPPRPLHAAVSVSVFFDELSPYGRWAEVGHYGHCWIPERVAVGWQPYTDGEWVYTDYGWTWVSYDPWGGDPYHYGTWAQEDPYGWVWIPGTVWAPAWVTWSYGDAYVGWAPIPPSLEISFSGYFGPAVVVAQTQYVFVPVNQFAGVRVSSVRLPVQQNSTLLQQTQRMTSFSVSKGIVVNRGPSVQRIESAAHTRIPRASISAAKSRPTSISAAGIAHGKHVSVIAPASVRARDLQGRTAAHKNAAPEKGGRAPASGETRHERKPKGESAKPEHGARHEATTSTRSTEHPATGGKRHEAPPPHHEAPPPHHEAPAHHEAPPPHHEAPARHEASPPHHEAPARHEAPPPHHEAPPPHHEAPPPHHEAAPPPRHEEPPPPPSSTHVEPPPAAHAGVARPAPAAKPKNPPEKKKDEGNPHGE